MNKTRLEAFSDAVIAIIMTIMVLELKVPHGKTLADLRPLLPTFTCYLLSFIFLGIYWGNHHHLLHSMRQVSGRILWANLHLLFWLSLFPFCTGWMGENHESPAPFAAYGIVLLMAALAYLVLQQTIVAHEGSGSMLKSALGSDLKGKLSPFVYITAIALAFVNTWLSSALYATIALVWLIPDRRIEREFEKAK